MLIIGHEKIPSPDFFYIEKIEDIKSTAPNAVLIFDFSKNAFDIAAYCRENALSFGIKCTQKVQALYAENLRAKFIIADTATAKIFQKIANEYLFDAKIAVVIEDASTLDALLDDLVDAAIFNTHIQKVSASS